MAQVPLGDTSSYSVPPGSTYNVVTVNCVFCDFVGSVVSHLFASSSDFFNVFHA